MTRTATDLALKNAPMFSKLQAPYQREDVWFPTYDLGRNRPTYSANLQRNRISSHYSTVPETETLPRSLTNWLTIQPMTHFWNIRTRVGSF
ncbi:hypothetical protein AVEN_225721-1 [Araneus ventricosus]|uniref:Uncharacterized protein n=1 Tax=Araneus ventricosus TaxID=182803 RepID=A0A4Y2PBL2_ARAVE|nr:hypothetical protein AVEN_225721-1 [Araneus ventricosus]